MLRPIELAHLLRGLNDTRALSVYVPARAAHAAGQLDWRRTFALQMAALRETLGTLLPAEEAALARAVVNVAARLRAEENMSAHAGWVAVATESGLRLAEPLETEMTPFARWTRGAVVAPYVFAMASTLRVVAVVLSSSRARLFRCDHGGTSVLPAVTVAPHEREIAHMGSPPQPGFHAGTTGETAAEARQRMRRTRRQRLLAATSEQLAQQAGNGEWLVLGGAAPLAAALHRALPRALAARAITVPSLLSRATVAAVSRAALDGAAVLQGMDDLVTVDELLERYGADTRGAAGPDATRRALVAGAVHQLLLTRRFLEQHPDAAEDAVHATLQQGGWVRPITGAAAERLEAEGHGIGAVLRFVPGAPGGGAGVPARRA